jgi:hypothetical protein
MCSLKNAALRRNVNNVKKSPAGSAGDEMVLKINYFNTNCLKALTIKTAP